MHSNLTVPLSILISLSLLTGWFINDFQIGVVIDSTIASAPDKGIYQIKEVDLSSSLTTPDIATNWFTGSTASLASQFPAGQSRKSDEDEHITQGRILGESFGNDRPI